MEPRAWTSQGWYPGGNAPPGQQITTTPPAQPPKAGTWTAQGWYGTSPVAAAWNAIPWWLKVLGGLGVAYVGYRVIARRK
jgi:hypothetical protein